ncbi:MAG: ABC transporter permease subunit/CPBP intramembrane protease [Byssovorax sp.]
MRLFLVWVILKKELTETLRDRRTLIRLLLIPVLLYPLFAIAISKLQDSDRTSRAAKGSQVAVWGELPPSLKTRLEASTKLDLRPWEGAPAAVRAALETGSLAPAIQPEEPPPDDEPTANEGQPKAKGPWVEPENPVLAAARELIEKRAVDAVLVPWPGASAALESGAEAPVSIYFDSVRADSALARERLEDHLARARKALLAERETGHGLARGFTRAVYVLPRNVAPPRRRLGQILGSMMPMLLIMMSLLGGFLPAVDLTAGEKERGTMQTLLCAPLRPIEIITGKFLAVFSISLLTALCNVVSMSFTLGRIIPGEIPVPIGIYALTFVLLIPVSFLFSALFLALAVFARDFKDGQNVLMPVYLPITLLAGLTALPGIELDAWTAFAPVLNIALLIKALFLGEARADLILLALGSSALYAALALLLAARVFEREHVLLGGKDTARALLGLERRHGGEPSAAFSVTAFGAIFVLFFYGSLLLERFGVVTALLLTQYGFFLLPAVGVVLLFGFSTRETLALRLPSPRSTLAAVVLGLSAWAVAIGLLLRLVPVPESLARSLGDLLLLGGKPFFVVFVVFALTPALCEELLFRGLLLSGLRKLGPTAAVIITSLLFGLAHASVYRLLPTAFLGAVIGLTRLRTRSIFPGMIIHALNNGLALALLYYNPPWAGDLLAKGTLPWGLTLGGCAVFAVGLALLPRKQALEAATPAPPATAP